MDLIIANIVIEKRMNPPFDPNAPDCSNGDFFCKLCLASMNSEHMWTSHIVGKRHIKNVQKYPNGLPNRWPSDDEDSYDKTANNERYEDDSDYPFSQNEDYHYYDNPMDYVPVVRPNLVIDYGHSKKLDEILPGSKTSEVAHQKKKDGGEEEISIVNEIIKSDKKEKEPKKDSFFEAINQREIAKELATELAKKMSKKEEEEKRQSEKCLKRKTSLDILDIFHKRNDSQLFKVSKIEKDSSSSRKTSTKTAEKINKIDPDKLTPDMLDDLLSAYLKPKNDSVSTAAVQEPPANLEKPADTDDSEVIAKKLQALPTKNFLCLVLHKLKNMDVKDSEELNILLKVICEAQEVIAKKLPPHIQALVKAKISESNSKKLQLNVQNVISSQNCNVPIPSAQLQNTAVSQSFTVPSASLQVQNTAGSQNHTILPASLQIQNTAVSQSYTVPSAPLQVQNAAVSQSYTVPSALLQVQNAAVSQSYTVPPAPLQVQTAAVSQSYTVPPASLLVNSYPTGVQQFMSSVPVSASSSLVGSTPTGVQQFMSSVPVSASSSLVRSTPTGVQQFMSSVPVSASSSLVGSTPTGVQQFMSSVPVSVSSSLVGSTPTTNAIFFPTQTASGRFSVPVAYQAQLQNNQTNNITEYSQFMQFLQSRLSTPPVQPVPPIPSVPPPPPPSAPPATLAAVNSVRSTLTSHTSIRQPHTVSQPHGVSKNVQEALKKLKQFEADYKSKVYAKKV